MTRDHSFIWIPWRAERSTFLSRPFKRNGVIKSLRKEVLKSIFLSRPSKKNQVIKNFSDTFERLFNMRLEIVMKPSPYCSVHRGSQPPYISGTYLNVQIGRASNWF